MSLENTGLPLRRCALVACAALLLPVQGCAVRLLAQEHPAAYFEVERTPIGGVGGWDFLTFDRARGRLFISRGDRVQVWDPRSRKVVGQIEGTPGVHGVALAPELNRGFTSNGRANSVSVFDLEDLHAVKTIAIAGVNPDAILYEPRMKRIYTFNGRSHDMTVIDAVGLRVVAQVALGGKPEVPVSDGQGHLFVNIEDTAQLVAIDEATNQVRSRWPLSPCEEPTGLAIDVAHQRLFSACANHRMIVTDARSGRAVASVPIGAGPDGAEFDPALGLAFSSNGEGSLSVVHEDDPEHFTSMGDVPTESRARTLALDPLSHRIYLVTARFGAAPPATPEQPKPRAPMIPGTFTVIVMAPR